ncbi:MAG: hypothetical protein A4E56_00115 [Pelotomaculum sp. PtaU1.Bin065]|nr:MAG: hypothetical protein A4E56_00115 [Pelotomaculum sp. PtaU1.Bin065]
MTIATKEQERKALTKIKTIVKSLGENSYLAAAFTGAFELAEQNIENDWGLTTQEYIDKAHRVEEIVAIEAKLEVAQESAKNLEESLYKTQAAQRKAETARIIAESEVIRLKAKLYDYMVKEQAGA